MLFGDEIDRDQSLFIFFFLQPLTFPSPQIQILKTAQKGRVFDFKQSMRQANTEQQKKNCN